jgi:hypothetical protein
MMMGGDRHGAMQLILLSLRDSTHPSARPHTWVALSGGIREAELRSVGHVAVPAKDTDRDCDNIHRALIVARFNLL